MHRAWNTDMRIHGPTAVAIAIIHTLVRFRTSHGFFHRIVCFCSARSIGERTSYFRTTTPRLGRHLTHVHLVIYSSRLLDLFLFSPYFDVTPNAISDTHHASHRAQHSSPKVNVVTGNATVIGKTGGLDRSSTFTMRAGLYFSRLLVSYYLFFSPSSRTMTSDE